MVINPLGEVLGQAEEHEEILHFTIDPKLFHGARAGIPVTVQRRFDVYPDVSSEVA
jgi:omega-amidase